MEFFRLAGERSTVRSYVIQTLSNEEKSNLLALKEKLLFLPNARPVNWKLEEDAKALGRFFAYVHEDSIFSSIEYGFEGEQLILHLVSLGYGTMWQAIGTQEEVPAFLRFGQPKEENLKGKFFKTLVRGGLRRPFQTFIKGEEGLLDDRQRRIIEAMILSPSALNRQPWSFTILSNNALRIELTDKKPLNFLDLGIVLAHGALGYAETYGSYCLKKREMFVWELSY